ncbi:fungal-specific transcription factor domain-containing protein [Radiomyces spectabilis]|uniref:fungal-specific transcription factor domain-containing protein n=1 Tax=Radiomyces spectabilis TaxID=64574 RepID=UPI00221FCD4A|nr:fungal-specific transcription factor domain-containing protein [Radiomyces spectabilis]KAI8379646.1 fungal-specific transcription factor domain-containing protein [Radiomyces spectabilis]
MEALLTQLTQLSIKELEQDDFRFHGQVNLAEHLAFGDETSHQLISKRQDHHGQDDLKGESAQDTDGDHNDVNEEDEEEEDDDDDNDNYSEEETNQKDPHAADRSVTLEEKLADLSIEDYDSLKYAGKSAGLNTLLDEQVFKSKSYIAWPGRDDVVLQRMSQSELMIVRTGRSASGKSGTRLNVGISMRSGVFDEPYSHHRFPTDTLKKLSKNLSNRMITLYFSHIHSFLPVINKPRFLSQFHQPTTSPATNHILLHAVLALSFRFASQHFPSLVESASDYASFYAAKVFKRLRNTAQSRLCHIQAALLMTLYLDLDDGDVDSFQWYLLGSAIRMAQDLGLHRSCAHWKLPASEIETRHRVFYACYVMDRWMSARAGKPLTILDRDFDTELPSPYEVSDAGLPILEESTPIYHSFLLFIKLSEILGRVLKALYAPKAKHANINAGLDDPTILVVFDRRLKQWRASLDEPLNGVELSSAQKGNFFDSQNKTKEIYLSKSYTRIRTFIVPLLIFYHTAVILAHRPFLELTMLQSINEQNAIEIASWQPCADSAASLNDIIKQIPSLKATPEVYSSFCLPTCFVYAMFQSSLVLLSALLKDRASSEKLTALQQSLALIKQHETLAPARQAYELLNMMIIVHDIKLSSAVGKTAITSSKFSPLPSTQVASLLNKRSRNITRHKYSASEEIPKSKWFQHTPHPSMFNTYIPPGTRRQVESLIAHEPLVNRFMSTHSDPSGTLSDPLASHWHTMHRHSFYTAPPSDIFGPVTHYASSPLPMTASPLSITALPPRLSSSMASSYHKNIMATPASIESPMMEQILSPQPVPYMATEPAPMVSAAQLQPSNVNWTDWNMYLHQQQSFSPSVVPSQAISQPQQPSTSEMPFQHSLYSTIPSFDRAI